MNVTFEPGFREIAGFPKEVTPSLVDLMRGGAVERLQATMLEMPQYEPVTEHYFSEAGRLEAKQTGVADGMYCRSVFREKGVLVVGKVHKREHFYVIANGTVEVTTENGLERLTGPAVVVSKPGTKRAVWALTDATCMTFHRTDLTDLDAIERELLEEDPTALFDSANRLKVHLIEAKASLLEVSQ